ncbi:MAG TPA: cyclase family protein [Xanthobacteraceae bacterium]|jgi:kynurenine formamidase|nr:cyclase family protein [Xanthobacteraceae bacterium]
MTQSSRWKKRPEGSTWGDFGPDDQLGRLNLLTPEKVKQGIAEVREGLSFCLSLPLDLPGGNGLNPRRHPPVLRPTLREKRPNWNYRLSFDDPSLTDVINDDLVVMHLQYSTQWDSLAHVGSLFDADGDGVPEPVFYNGFRADEHLAGPTEPGDAGAVGQFEQRSTSRARALSVEVMAEKCIQGRGVMIDIHAHVGREHEVIGYDDLMRIIDADKVEVETGDMVLLHTGFADMLMEMKGNPDPHALHNSCAALNGRDQRLLKWISDSGLVALIADNYAVEAHPSVKHFGGCCAALPLHEHCLFKLGVNLGELWYLTSLANWLRAHGRNRFLLTAPPLRLPGAVGSPATPVATV